MARPFAWTKSEREGVVEIAVRGTINEHTDFDALAKDVAGGATLHLADVDNINSIGVRAWMRFVRQCEADGHALSLVACAPVLVAQMNMIVGFAGGARVRSILAPYVCPSCDADATRLLDVDHDVQGQLAAPFVCSCGAAMEFDDLPGQYFAFMTTQP